MLGEQHGHAVRLLTRGARRHPDAHGVGGSLVAEELRDMRFQRGERLAVAEEVGDRDEQVLQQRARLAGMGAQEG